MAERIPSHPSLQSLKADPWRPLVLAGFWTVAWRWVGCIFSPLCLVEIVNAAEILVLLVPVGEMVRDMSGC